MGTIKVTKKVTESIEYSPCIKCGSDDIRFINCGYSSFNVGSATCQKCGNKVERTAVILDSRIPNDWYSDTFCSTCTPMDLIPLPQRIKQLLDIDRGLREEREVEMNGIKFMMTTTRQIKEPEIIYAPYIMKLNEGKTEG